LVELGLIGVTEVETLIDQLARDRFEKAQLYLKFARRLDPRLDIDQPHIISRSYYAMYHAARAVVFHTRRADVDDHEKLATMFTQVAGGLWGMKLDEWRKMRNRVEYSPYLPADLVDICSRALEDGEGLLGFCEEYLRKREVSSV